MCRSYLRVSFIADFIAYRAAESGRGLRGTMSQIPPHWVKALAEAHIVRRS